MERRLAIISRVAGEVEALSSPSDPLQKDADSHKSTVLQQCNRSSYTFQKGTQVETQGRLFVGHMNGLKRFFLTELISSLAR